MIPIEKIRDGLVGRFPELRIEIDPPVLENGSWFLDVYREGGLDPVNVEWRPDREFGVTAPGPDDYGIGADEVDGGAKATFDRVVHLIETGGQTVPPSPSDWPSSARAGGSRRRNWRSGRGSSRRTSRGSRGATLSIRARFPDGTERELEF